MDTVERISIEEKEDSDLDRLLLQSSPPPRPTKAAACEDGENDNGGTSDDSTMHAARAQAGRAIIHDEDDDDDDNDDDGASGHWIMPAPARRGDYLSSSLHRVPSKSILKKVSSYGNFDNDSSSIQQSPRTGGMGTMGMKKISSLLSFANTNNNNIDSSTRSSRSWNGTTSGNMGKKTPSSLSFHADVEHSSFSSIPETEDANVDNARTSSYLNTGGESLQRVNFGDDSQSIGWDLDDSLPSIHGRSSSCASPTTLANSSPAAPPGFLPNIQPPPPPDDDNDNDIINGMDSSVGGGCGGGTAAAAATIGMSRTVSFNSVNVREYDRTVGDNPSCRSGPPLSLDWSYSKKYEKDLDEYELERSSERVTTLKKLHVNKYRRKNMLGYTWGHTEDEFKEARKSTKKMQRQRSMTQLMLPLHRAEEAFVGITNFMAKRRGSGGSNDDDDVSEMSNSNSTKDSSQRSSGRHHHWDGRKT